MKTWCAANETVSAFDHNGSGRIGLAKIAGLFIRR
jgi:hypothetical protein